MKKKIAPINMDAAAGYALDVIINACCEFPGLVDGESETSGADLVEYLCIEIARRPDLIKVIRAHIARQA